MDIRQIHYFVETAKYGSFSRAAKGLFVSHQALSKSISLLEKEYQCQLFIRMNNRLVLSDAGQQALPRAKKLLESYRELDHSFKKLAEAEKGVFRVAVAHNVLTLLKIDMFNEYSLKYPQLKPDFIELPDKIVDIYIEADQVDVCFNINTLPNQEDYESILLLESELCVFDTKEEQHSKGGNFAQLEELKNKKIVMQGDWYKAFDILMKDAQAEQIGLNDVLKTADTALTVEMMSLPGYVSVAPYAFFGIRKNCCERAVPFRPSLPWNVYLSYKKYKVLPKPVEKFIDNLKRSYPVQNRLAPR
ncbi:LysR family transcriptional regulator [Desulfitobacterium sp. THU1]|uniref:LysR family transcriptional regulator n=1 Tax=Desulfitobacterium sp. THU1 TaxID=3138072 RepID=UPI00311EE72C